MVTEKPFPPAELPRYSCKQSAQPTPNFCTITTPPPLHHPSIPTLARHTYNHHNPEGRVVKVLSMRAL
ncbi:hypothetical protein BGX38DRAFT_1169233 [Terfezia claveryi]|nr:hypothetical protein BGX38DRAFT_1169233 [Terfezia claveryi]